MTVSEIKQKLATFDPPQPTHSSIVPLDLLKIAGTESSLAGKNIETNSEGIPTKEKAANAFQAAMKKEPEKISLAPSASQKGPSPDMRVSPPSPSPDDPCFLTPKLTGKYRVGVKSFYADSEQKLLVDVHYPGIVTTNPAYRILPPSPGKHPMNTDGIEDTKTKARLENLWTRSQPELEAVQGKFPVVLFSHGMPSDHTDYQHLVEELASHGYCVMTMSHAASNSVSDLAKISPNFPGVDEMIRVVKKQADEVLFLSHQIRKGAFKDKIGEIIDINQIGVCGHSLGGDTALQACRRTNLIRTGIDLDGGALKHKELVTIRQPFLSIGAGHGTYSKEPLVEDKEIWDGNKEWADYKKVSNRAELDILLEAQHNDFSIQPLFNAIKTGESNENYLKIYKEISQKIVNWFNTHLKNS